MRRIRLAACAHLKKASLPGFFFSVLASSFRLSENLVLPHPASSHVIMNFLEAGYPLGGSGPFLVRARLSRALPARPCLLAGLPGCSMRLRCLASSMPVGILITWSSSAPPCKCDSSLSLQFTGCTLLSNWYTWLAGMNFSWSLQETASKPGMSLTWGPRWQRRSRRLLAVLRESEDPLPVLELGPVHEDKLAASGSLATSLLGNTRHYITVCQVCIGKQYAIVLNSKN